MNIPPQGLDDRLGQAFSSMAVAMIVVDPRGTIVRANRLAEATFGYPDGELLGQRVELLIPDRLRHAHVERREGYLGGATARPMGKGRELSARRKDGSEFPVEIGLNPMDTDEGVMTLSVIVDLSERKHAEQRLQDALAQKDLLLREVHHRVKNNLQVVHSLLDLQALQLEDPTALQALRDSQHRIRSMSLIHQTLYQSADVARVDLQRFLNELLPGLAESYRMSVGAVDLQVRAQSVTLPLDAAIPCGLIVNELVSNAFKHGFSQGGSGCIAVTLDRLEDDRIELVVSNDGTPLAADLDLDRTPSLGLQLVRLLARQLGASLELQRANPTQFTLRFPPGH